MIATTTTTALLVLLGATLLPTVIPHPDTGDVVVVSSDVCNLPVDEGLSCENSTEAWYYRPKMDDCTFFIYGGCGNKNRFSKLVECEATCQLNPPCPYINCPETCIETRDKNNCTKCNCSKVQKMKICEKTLARGNGRALMQRWGWNIKTKSCQDFAYGGLPGNNNNFSTKKECEDFCSGI